MKHVTSLLFLLISFSSLQTYAQFRPFVEDNKTWIVRDGAEGGEEMRSSYLFYQIKGDTLINDVRWHKLYITKYYLYQSRIYYGNGRSLYQLLREDKGRVFSRTPLDSFTFNNDVYYTPERGDVFIDYSASVGDTLYTLGRGASNSYNILDPTIVKEKSKSEFLGKTFSTIEVEVLWPNATSPSKRLQLTWIEGLGSFPDDPFYNDDQDAWGDYGRRPIDLIYCGTDEEVLCIDEPKYERMQQSISNLLTELDINVPTLDTNTANGSSVRRTFDLQGRRLQGVPQRGVFIREGRKMIR